MAPAASSNQRRCRGHLHAPHLLLTARATVPGAVAGEGRRRRLAGELSTGNLRRAGGAARNKGAAGVVLQRGQATKLGDEYEGGAARNKGADAASRLGMSGGGAVFQGYETNGGMSQGWMRANPRQGAALGMRGLFAQYAIKWGNCGRLYVNLSHLQPHPSDAHPKTQIRVSIVCTC